MRHAMRPVFLAAGLTLSFTIAAAEPEPVQAPDAGGTPAAAGVEKLERVTREQTDADKAAAASQQRINQLDDETQKMLTEYRRAIADTESFDAYAAQLGRQIRSQEEEIGDIERQLAEIEDTSRAIAPLEQKMLDTLAQFVELDLPFLVEERTARIRTLRAMMDRADVSISEKYRRIVEAYQVEMDYGRTIETYDGSLAGRDASRTAKFLRIGRVSLLYQTLDGRETGYWNAASKRWVVDNDYAHSFRQGVAVAQKISAPEMIVAPVPAPAEVRS